MPHAVMIPGKGPCAVDYDQNGEWGNCANLASKKGKRNHWCNDSLVTTYSCANIRTSAEYLFLQYYFNTKASYACDCPGLKEIIIDRKAGEAVLRGADVFVPGVLASNPGLAVGDRVAVTVALERDRRFVLCILSHTRNMGN